MSCVPAGLKRFTGGGGQSEEQGQKGNEDSNEASADDASLFLDRISSSKKEEEVGYHGIGIPSTPSLPDLRSCCLSTSSKAFSSALQEMWHPKAWYWSVSLLRLIPAPNFKLVSVKRLLLCRKPLQPPFLVGKN